ncbi:MAG: DegV family EDD domain-containing protein [Gammaproteobacteria bacterium]|nr:DegV family EDD domain-containing protein [Gammaproteobacteria bacterium]
MPSPITRHLDGDAFASALVSGIHRVIGNQELLNQINVFPVADGDTGTNLSLSLGSVLALLQGPGEKHLGTLLASVADALLDSARGNSGAIVAQFFQGVSDSTGELSRFTTRTFGNAIVRGSEYANDALSKPCEGTILTVIAAVAETISDHARMTREGEFSALMKLAVQSADVSLAKTTEQLDVLRRAGVVDAGAKGFVELIKGMSEFIQYGRIADAPDLTTLQSEIALPAMAGSAEDSEFRYCTECIVTGSNINRRKLREALSALGNSLVLAGTKRKAKIHIHVNDPKIVFAIGGEYGQVSAEKADDMHRQTHSTHDASKRFAVITDSAADIADEDMERLDIHMVPCRVQFGDRGYLDKVSITAEEFFAELETNPDHPTTSQPAPGDFRRQFQFLASHFADVISVNLTSAASGTYAAACSAAGRVAAPGRIHVINTRNASVGQGLVAVFAAECANAGLSADDTITAIERIIPQTNTIGVLNDVSYAVRGGRLPSWVSTITRLLHVTPFIRTTVDGKIAASGFAFGASRRVRKFARHVASRVRSTEALIVTIGHAVCADDARELAMQLRKELPQIHRVTIAELGAGLGSHTGPGTLIVGAQPYVAPADLIS